jgi:hypothetical protein
MSTGQPTHYDPLAVFVAVFSDPQYEAEQVADALTCVEVNVLVALLESRDQPEAAARWMAHHLLDCDDPARHDN